MQNDVDNAKQMDMLAKHGKLIGELRALVGSEETSFSGVRSLQVTFLAGQQQPDVGRIEVVQRQKAVKGRGN